MSLATLAWRKWRSRKKNVWLQKKLKNIHPLERSAKEPFGNGSESTYIDCYFRKKSKIYKVSTQSIYGLLNESITFTKSTINCIARYLEISSEDERKAKKLISHQ